MTQVTVDLPLASILKSSAEPTPMVDAAGRLLGYFVPSAETQRELYDRAWENFDPDEFQASLKEGGGRSLEEILDELQAQP